MAEAILSQISGDFLECTICMEPFKDPKILPCLHTFCKGCLEKFVLQKEKPDSTNNDDDDTEVKDKFPCPTCRTETELPGGGVAGLKNNFFVLSLRDTVDTHKSLVSKEDDKVPCDNCEEHVAIHGCVVCEEFLCDECARVHRRAKRTRDHEVIGVAELKELLLTKPSSVKSTSLPMCPKHEDEKLKFYCKTCKHPICRDCTVLQHKDHGYSYMADVVSDVRAKIKGKLESAKPKVEEYRQFAGIVTKKQEELDTMSKKASDDIDAAAEEEIKYYNDLIRRKQTELQEKLAAITAARSKQLSATADSVESTLGCLSSTVDFSQKVVKHGSDFDVMNVYSDVTTRLESLLKGPTPDIPGDISNVRFHRRTEGKEKGIILGDIVGDQMSIKKPGMFKFPREQSGTSTLQLVERQRYVEIKAKEEKHLREKADLLLKTVQWFYIDDNEEKQPYEAKANCMIEEAFVAKKRGVDFEFEGEDLHIDFLTMKETVVGDTAAAAVDVIRHELEKEGRV